MTHSYYYTQTYPNQNWPNFKGKNIMPKNYALNNSRHGVQFQVHEPPKKAKTPNKEDQAVSYSHGATVPSLL